MHQASVAEAAKAVPNFDPYLNETWGKREAVLGTFQQGVRVAALRTRVDLRIRTLRASLQRAGIALTDKAAVRQLVISRTKGGAGASPAPSAESGAGGASNRNQEGSEHGLSMSGLAHFAFPEPPDKGAQPQV